VSNKIKPNRYKPEVKNGKDKRSDSGIVICRKSIITVLSIIALSLGSIFIYDFITQSSAFSIKKIEISGTRHVSKEDILKLTDLNSEKNILKINLVSIEKRILSHPWVQSVNVKRHLDSVLSISIVEHEALAIVKIGNLADLLINHQGRPFKEYKPTNDIVKNLPIITGIELVNANNRYLFKGVLFDSIVAFLRTGNCDNIRQINGNKNTGVTIEANDIYNRMPSDPNGLLQIKLGFNNFRAKLDKAKDISTYIGKNFPERTICSMDLFNIEKVFIKTKLTDALHNNIEKGA